MALYLHLQFAHHQHDEFEEQRDVTSSDVLRAFDSFDWVGETRKAGLLQRVSPSLSVESDTKDRLIWVSSVDGPRGLEFISECSFPGEVRRAFGFVKGFGTVTLETQKFDASQAKEALRLFLDGSFADLRQLYKEA